MMNYISTINYHLNINASFIKGKWTAGKIPENLPVPGKAVLLHTMEVNRVRGGIALTHS
jgi:hypothetical protein